MTLRGIISPPRSRSSPRETRPLLFNNPPSRPNFTSPRRRRPVNSNPNELQPSQRKESTQSTTAAAKPASAIRATTKTNDERSSASKIGSSRRQTAAAPDPNDKKTATKISSRPSSSPRTATKPVTQLPRSGPTPPSKTKGAVGLGGGSGSRSDISGAKASGGALKKGVKVESPKHSPSFGLAQQQDIKIGGHFPPALGDHDVHNQLQQLSFDGKDLASIVLQANSIYESLSSDTKEEYSSSASNNNNAPRIFQIYKEITSHRQENSSITSYVTKLKELWDELATYSDLPQCSCGDHREREKVMQFLAGLNDSYSTICSQILLIRRFPTLQKAYGVLIREEKRRELVLSLEIVAAKAMQNNWLLQNAHSSNSGDDDGGVEDIIGNNLHEQKVDLNEVTSIRIDLEPLLIDLGSPVRC